MRYYDDGDLIDGLKIATKPLGAEQLAGDYHVVWTFCNGKKKTLDWSSDLSLEDWNLTISHTTEEDKPDPLRFTAALMFGTLDLKYMLEYQNTKCNHLKLIENHAPGSGAVEDELVLTFSDVRDEQGFPYLHCNFATNEHNPDDDMTNISFVAKRTDTEGILQLGLTKNEKLRLGYAVWDDGTFEPEDAEQEINNQNPEQLQQALHRHMEASVKIHSRLLTIQETINKQVINATNGMHQVMNKAWRAASVANPSIPHIMQSHERGKSPTSPPAKRRKGQNAIAGGLDPELTPPSQRRKKDGLENTPTSMELDNHHPESGSGQKRKRGSNFLRGGGGRGGRKSLRQST